MKNKIGFAILAAVLVLITVLAASAQALTITSTPATTATVGQQYTYDMNVDVADATFGVVSGPSDFSVAASTGVFTWTPSVAGTFPVNLFVLDNANSSSVQYQAFNIVVNQAVSSKMLEIDEIQVKVSGSKDTLSGPGTIDKDAELGDEIEITVTVKNNFAVREDSTIIRNIDMEISSDLDDADGLDESISRLEAGRDDDMTVTFTLDPENVIPSDAPFDITVDVEGKTSDGTIYRDSWTIRLDMNTRSRDLYILSVDASPLSFTSCNDNTIRITADLRNIGTRDLDDAALRFKISQLGINKIVSGIELDSDDDDTFSDYITIPKGITPGTYELDIDALPQRTVNTVTSMTALDVTVLKCSDTATEDNTDNEDTNTNNNGGTIIIPDVAVTGTPVSTAVGKKGLFDSDSSMYLVFLGALIVLLLVIIILVMTRLRE